MEVERKKFIVTHQQYCQPQEKDQAEEVQLETLSVLSGVGKTPNDPQTEEVQLETLRTLSGVGKAFLKLRSNDPQAGEVQLETLGVLSGVGKTSPKLQ